MFVTNISQFYIMNILSDSPQKEVSSQYFERLKSNPHGRKWKNLTIHMFVKGLEGE